MRLLSFGVVCISFLFCVLLLFARYSNPATDFRILGVQVFTNCIGKKYQNAMCVHQPGISFCCILRKCLHNSHRRCDAVREVIKCGLMRNEDLTQCTVLLMIFRYLSKLTVLARYYPSIRSCIESLISMVDVSRCFVGENIVWPNSDSAHLQRIKPPPDPMVQLPHHLLFTRALIIAIASAVPLLFHSRVRHSGRLQQLVRGNGPGQPEAGVASVWPCLSSCLLSGFTTLSIRAPASEFLKLQTTASENCAILWTRGISVPE